VLGTPIITDEAVELESSSLAALVSRRGAALTFAACALLPLLGFFAGAPRLLMGTDDAAGAGAENAMMAGIMPSNATDDGTLQTASRLHWSRNPAGCHQNDKGRWQQHEFHSSLLRNADLGAVSDNTRVRRKVQSWVIAEVA
jgi:hypothetical protein